MTSWLRKLGDDLRLVDANGTPRKKLVSYPDREYMAFRVGTTEEEIYLHYYPGEPEEIIETGGCILAGPLPNGRLK